MHLLPYLGLLAIALTHNVFSFIVIQPSSLRDCGLFMWGLSASAVLAVLWETRPPGPGGLPWALEYEPFGFAAHPRVQAGGNP
jgi:hypothetical protein